MESGLILSFSDHSPVLTELMKSALLVDVICKLGCSLSLGLRLIARSFRAWTQQV